MADTNVSPVTSDGSDGEFDGSTAGASGTYAGGMAISTGALVAIIVVVVVVAFFGSKFCPS